MIRTKGKFVPARSIKDIRSAADITRELLGVVDVPLIGELDIAGVLDIKLPQLFPEYSLDVVPETEIQEEAITFPDKMTIVVRESVFDAASAQWGTQQRFTLAHELGHLILHQDVASFARNQKEFKIYHDSEWQADTFAAEVLMPYDEVISTCQSIEDIIRRFNVSKLAAKIRFDKVLKNI